MRALASRLADSADRVSLSGVDIYSMLHLSPMSFRFLLGPYLIQLVRSYSGLTVSSETNLILAKFVTFLSPRPELESLDWQDQLAAFAAELMWVEVRCLIDSLRFALDTPQCDRPSDFEDAINYWTPRDKAAKKLLAEVRRVLPGVPLPPREEVEQLYATGIESVIDLAQRLETDSEPEAIFGSPSLILLLTPASFRFLLRAHLVMIVKYFSGKSYGGALEQEMYTFIEFLSPHHETLEGWQDRVASFKASLTFDEGRCIYQCLGYANGSGYVEYPEELQAAIDYWSPWSRTD